MINCPRVQTKLVIR
uniref:Uncharacterized protein n=1 Tax=Arundo donax TaxID=35708 RepID=A0A0A8ZRK2_ARUDO